MPCQGSIQIKRSQPLLEVKEKVEGDFLAVPAGEDAGEWLLLDGGDPLHGDKGEVGLLLSGGQGLRRAGTSRDITTRLDMLLRFVIL